MKDHRTNRRAALLVTAVAATSFLSVSGPASAAARPLAAFADSALHPPAPASAAAALDAMTQKYLDDPDQWAGAWFDYSTGQVVTAVPAKATQQTLTMAQSAAGSTGKVKTVSRSFADLKRISDDIINRPAIASIPISSTGMDWEHNAVVVGLERITDDVRAALATEFGDAVTVREVPRAQREDGPDRWRDRYPYWGGSGWGTPQEGRVCSTAFGMRRADRSKKFLVTAGHCNSPTVRDAATLNTGSTSWNNVIGTSKGYQNSLCGTKSSCEIGSTKYGDISVIRVSGIEPRIYHGGARATGSIPVVDTQYSHPKLHDSMCISGSTTGSTCEYMVMDNFTTVKYDEPDGSTAIMTPVVATQNVRGNCTSGGDSGGAVYKPVNGGASASGIHSGGNATPGNCWTYYTSIYYAQKLFDVITETTSTS